MALVWNHLYTGWEAAIDEPATHQERAIFFTDYMVQWIQDTAENLQSEFWQLAVQFALLAGFFEFMRTRKMRRRQAATDPDRSAARCAARRAVVKAALTVPVGYWSWGLAMTAGSRELVINLGEGNAVHRMRDHHHSQAGAAVAVRGGVQAERRKIAEVADRPHGATEDEPRRVAG